MNIRRLLIVLVFCCLEAMKGFGQNDYIPMVQEGKQWLYGKGDWGNYSGSPFSYQLEGDTVIGSKEYKKMFKQMEGTAERSYYAALRETDRRVYAVISGQNSEGLVYDYNLIKEGCTTEYENGDIATSSGILWTALGSDGLPHRIIAVHVTNSSWGIMPTGGPTWVEGIGNIGHGYDLLDARGYTGSYFFEFLACYLNGECVFRADDYFNIIDTSGFTLLKTQESHMSIYDLQGRPVARPSKGLYIQDGKKRVVK